MHGPINIRLQIIFTWISARMDTSDIGLSILKPKNVTWHIFCKSNVIPDVGHCCNKSRHWTARNTLMRYIDV